MFSIKSSRYHPEFDLRQAVKEYQQGHVPQDLEGQMITSPYDVYSVETLRDQLNLRTGTAVLADLFVYCKGDPPKPDCTKVGGTPYWTGDRDWPVDKKKKPLRFLGQFNFVDSKDLVGPIPGDVLLLFSSNNKRWLSEPLHFEWLPAGRPRTDITDSKRLLFPRTVFHGAIHRTADYPQACEAAGQSDVKQSWNLPILNGTKIGGRPHFVQGDDDLDARPAMREENPFRPGEMLVVPARPARHGFLCQLGSIQAEPNVTYPWCNQAEPLDLDFGPSGIMNDSNCLVFNDMGTICIYRSENGELWSDMETY